MTYLIRRTEMQVGMVGLGRMGMNMATRLLRGGQQVVAYNRSRDKTDHLVKEEGAQSAYTLEELVKKLVAPRFVWLMLPAGKTVDEHIEQLKGLLQKGDTIIDGGNSFYKDDQRRSSDLRPLGINYLDVGVSGGIWGLKVGYCQMIGGDRDIFEKMEPAIAVLAPKDGYLHCGPAGAGHFVKMVHNGIEYGMLEAYGEGFAILERSQFRDSFDFAKISHLWNQGSVVRSWLLELAEDAFSKDPSLSRVKGYVDDSGEGRWTILQAIEESVPAPVLALALFQRFRSRETESFNDRLIAALRNEFGGHAVHKMNDTGKS
jgi:6-phosphogluconate dehydrogenase